MNRPTLGLITEIEISDRAREYGANKLAYFQRIANEYANSPHRQAAMRAVRNLKEQEQKP